MHTYHIYDSVYSHVRCAFTQNAWRIKAELRSACSGVVSIIHVSAVFLISPDCLRPAKSASASEIASFDISSLTL